MTHFLLFGNSMNKLFVVTKTKDNNYCLQQYMIGYTLIYLVARHGWALLILTFKVF